MKLENENFPVYMNVPIRTIPDEDLLPILAELTCNAMFFMNTVESEEKSAKLVTGIKDHIISNYVYKDFPLHLIIESFHKGSTGELGGTTKFTLRNVNLWLFQTKEKHMKLVAEQISKDDHLKKIREKEEYKLTRERSSLFASAFRRKMEWAASGMLSDREYDELNLDVIVAFIEKGYPINELKPSHILK